MNPITTKERDAFHALLQEQQGLLPYSLRIMWTLRVKTGVRPEEAYGMHFVNVLDARFDKVGTKTWHQVDITKKE